MDLSMVYPLAERSVYANDGCSVAEKELYWAREMGVEMDMLSVDLWDQPEVVS